MVTDSYRRTLSPFAFSTPTRIGLLRGLLILVTTAWALLARPDAGRGQPVSLELAYTADLFGNARGGIREGVVYMDNLDLQAEIDLDEIFRGAGPTIFLYGLGNQGGALTEELVGDLQTVNEIEAPTSWRIYEAWIEQHFLARRLSVLGGLYDVNGEFYVTPAAETLINSSFGIGAAYGLSGRNGPSIFPVTSLGIRIRAKPSADTYLQGAVLDGVPGDPSEPGGTHVAFRPGEGLLWTGEAGYRRGRSKLAGGVWYYSSEFTAIGPSPRAFDGGGGWYGLAQTGLTDHEELFVQLGAAASEVQAVDGYYGFGATSTRWSGASLSLGVAHASVGTPYRRALRSRGIPTRSGETVLELTARTEPVRFLAIQADVQYVLAPSARGDRGHALVPGLRIVVEP